MASVDLNCIEHGRLKLHFLEILTESSAVDLNGISLLGDGNRRAGSRLTDPRLMACGRLKWHRPVNLNCISGSPVGNCTVDLNGIRDETVDLNCMCAFPLVARAVDLRLHFLWESWARSNGSGRLKRCRLSGPVL